MQKKTAQMSHNGIKAGAYLTEYSDQNGNTSRYTYDMSTGVQESITDAEGTTLNQSYYGTGEKLKDVTSGGTSVTYEYVTKEGVTGNHLSKIIINGTEEGQPSESYQFSYDSFGNTTTTSVGNAILASNVYGSKNGYLNHTDYGNGWRNSYTYGEMGELKKLEETGPDGTRQSYFWEYDADGTLISTIAGNKTSNYEYDSLGRFVRENIHPT